MKPLSTEAEALLAQLQSMPSRLGRQTSHARAQVNLIRQIACLGEPTTVLFLIAFLFDTSASVAAAAADAMAGLLGGAAVDDLLALDEQARRLSYWRGSAWHQLRPDRVDDLPKTEASRAAILGLASFHANGHVREVAVRRLATMPAAAGLPFLLIRVNDWVANVRAAARAGIEQWLRGGPLDAFLDNLPLLVRLADWRRTEHAGLVQAILRRLIGAGHAAALAEVIARGPRAVARPVFQLAVEAAGPRHLAGVTAAALQADDAVLRLWATRRLPAVVTGPNLQEALAAVTQDSSMPVRRAALAVRLEALPGTAIGS